MFHTPAHKFINKETPVSILSEFVGRMIRGSKPLKPVENGMFKPFFVHSFWPSGTKLPRNTSRGFTAYIEPDPEDYRFVYIRGTACSPKDQFCKKVGRQVCLSKTPDRVNKRDIPGFLEMNATLLNIPLPRNGFTYIYKYMF